jgi:hypothetical protein
MITLRLFGHETDANHFREEGRPAHLDRRGRLYDWRNDLRPLTMRRLLEPWTTQDDERLKAFATQGASVVKAAAALKRKIVSVRVRARALGCPFPPLRVVRQNLGRYIGLRLTPRMRPRRRAVARRSVIPSRGRRLCGRTHGHYPALVCAHADEAIRSDLPIDARLAHSCLDGHQISREHLRQFDTAFGGARGRGSEGS